VRRDQYISCYNNYIVLTLSQEATRLEIRCVRFVGVWQERASEVEGLCVNIYHTNIELTFSQ